MFSNCKNFVKRVYKEYVLLNPKYMDEEERRKLSFTWMWKENEQSLFLDVMNIYEKQNNKKYNSIQSKNKDYSFIGITEENEFLYSNSFEDIYIMNSLLNRKDLRINFQKNYIGLIVENKKKIERFYSNVLNSFQSRDEGKQKINEIFDMSKEEIDKKISEAIKIIPPKKKKYKLIEGTGKIIQIFFYLIFYIIPLLLTVYFFTTTKLQKEKYNSISFFDSEILNEIKTNDDINKLSEEKKDDLSLRMFKFADLGYQIRSKEKENVFPEPFMNWEIINYKLIGEDNSFYVLKDTKNKKLIVTFPGTNIASYQIFEEIMGSSLINFHKNHTNILISKYFGERISEILNYIFTPDVNNLIQNNYQMISTGHSLGGAIAQAFIYFSILENKITKNNSPMTITFNQPKVGNKIFSEFLDKNSLNIRFTKGSDIVSSIPFANFGFTDICKYIINKRNIYNEYVHTYNEINISNGFYIPSFIKVFLVILCIVAEYIFLYLIRIFLKELWDNYKFDEPLNKIILIVFYMIIFLSTFLVGFPSYYILLIAIKYGAYKFYLFFFIIIIHFPLFLNLAGIILLLVFFTEIIILFLNLAFSCLNLCINDEVKVEIDTIKFKKFNFVEKLTFIAGIIYVACGSLASFVFKDIVLSHMETSKRVGNEEFIYNGTKLDNLVEQLGESKNTKEIGFKILNLNDEGRKESLFIGN